MRPVENIVNGIDLRKHSGLIWRIVRRYSRFVGGILEHEDLFQSGWLGLHEAAKRFQPELGFQFSTYANWWIRQGVRRAIMNERRTIRIPVHAQEKAYHEGTMLALDLRSLDAPMRPSEPDSASLGDLLRSDDDPERSVGDEELAQRIGVAIDALPAPNRRAIRGRFWGDYTLAELGDDEGLSRERIRQRERDAKWMLERPLGKLRADV